MKKLIGLAFALVLAGCSESAPETTAAAPAQPSPFQEGVHFQVVNPEGKVDQPTVTEFFSFYCGGCYNMESRFLPTIVPALAEGVKFEQKHVNFARTEEDYQTYQAVIQGFAAVQQMGVEKQIKEPMFALMGGKHHNHVEGDKHGEGIHSLADVRAIFVEHGVDGDAFDQAASTPEVQSQVELWAKEQRQYQIGSIPAFVVNNKYLVNINSVETLGELVELMNYLATR
ncbi:thiol:disulfide interchange protein DsbA/DsbL [Ferrimonas balearica]|uniref:thiol:disulfide interchange protein DsbA/DsbL n=1 Tax=Ferrimonas balearica TaxID=44012 RepID=UPI001C98EA5A|nr:thiol:disulfide interchange protein DsbA/DsbL [Ferrimonas balearica]MBY5992571.1 thiol:disulfide interchange protein DsbA/DsbL [Ferrimonas balearica]